MQPTILTSHGTPLYRQVQNYLQADTDLNFGLVGALGNGAASIYPNFTSDGPNKDRTICPTPFLLVVDGGIRKVDAGSREFKVIIEVHDDPDHGDIRWPGLLERVKDWLINQNLFRPVNDVWGRYSGGVYFDEQSPPWLPDERFDTNMVQLIVAARGMDRTSNKGYNG